MIATKTMDGTKVMLDNSQEATFKMDLENYKARQLYSLLKDEQPERFDQMKTEGTLIAYLNETTWPYYQLARELMDQGMTVFQAEETAWQDLAQRAGL